MKTLLQEGIEGKSRGAAVDETLAGITDSLDVDLNRLQETVKDRTAWRAAMHEAAKSQI